MHTAGKSKSSRDRLSLRWAPALLAFTTLWFASGCTPMESPDELNSSMESEESSRIRGRTMAKSDVQTIEDAPVPSLVLAIPSARAGALLDALEHEGAHPPIGQLGISLPQAAFETYVVASDASGPDGTYSLSVQPGSYWLCLANVGRAADARPLPAYVNGCVEVGIQEARELTRDLFWGEAGVTEQ